MSLEKHQIKSNKLFVCTLYLCLISFLFWAPPIQAKIGIEFGSSTKSTQNLLNDNSDLYDVYSTTDLTFKLYPLSSVEVSLSGEHTYYRETIGLSNYFGRLKVSFIPTKPESRVSLYFSGSIDGRIYHNAFSGVDNNHAELNAAVGYRLSPRLALRGGVSYKTTVYVNTDTDHINYLDFFMGGNLTFLGRNSLDLELGLGRTNYTFKDAHLTGSALIPGGPPNPVPYDLWWLYWIPDSKDNLYVFYFSPRISRPLGSKTGINITYTQRNYQNYDGGLLWGLDTGFLSPWTTVWEGSNVSLNIKTYLIPKIIVTTGIGYWDKTFLITSDKQKWSEIGPAGPGHPGYVDRTYGEARTEDKARVDYVTKVYLGVKWPIVFRSGLYMEPNFNLEYADNKSNQPLYDFDNFSVTVGLSLRF